MRGDSVENLYPKYIKQHVLKKTNKNNLKNKNIMDNQEKIRVACILDQFSYECFKYEGEFLNLTINNWKDELTKLRPHFLFVEAAWEGFNKQWMNKVSNLNITKDKTLFNIIEYCRGNNIPTVFWAKEDPYDFDIFIDAAKLFDYVFTTDIKSIIKYKQLLNHNNVYLLPFAAQPAIHNPINKDKVKLGDIAFAGGWYYKFPERNMEIEYMLKPAFKYGLVIYDRFYYSKNKKHSFPLEYKPYIKKPLDYLDMVKEYKKYEIFLNVNSTKTSTTTFSRRIFELLACGIPIISSYSKGIEEYFTDIVLLSKNGLDTEILINSLLEHKEKRDFLSTLGIREVLDKHTYRHRFMEILNKLEINDQDSDIEGVTVITCTNRPNSLNNILNNYLSQEYKIKELIIIINNDSIDYNAWIEKVKDYPDIKLYKLSQEFSLGKCLNFAVEKSNYPFVSKFDDDDFYGPNYLIDSINAFKYTDAGVVGKKTIYAYLEGSQLLVLRYPNQEHGYCDYVAGSTLTIKKEVFNFIKFQELSRGEDTRFLMDCVILGIKIYATDRFNHVVIRRPNIDSHSWKIGENEFLKDCKIIKRTRDYKSEVIV